MKIIEPSFRLFTPSCLLNEAVGIGLLRHVESMMRISHRSEEQMTIDSWKRLVQSVVLERGDWSVTEHAAVTAVIRTDRGITHELVRHRLFSFTQESTRFVNYDKKDKNGNFLHNLEFIVPSGLSQTELGLWTLGVLESEHTYREMLSKGSSPQQARSVLPNSLAATIAVTGNLRNWRHFFLMRTSRETHPDMRRFTIPMLEEFKHCIPLLYDDIEPNARQIDNMRKPR